MRISKESSIELLQAMEVQVKILKEELPQEHFGINSSDVLFLIMLLIARQIIVLKNNETLLEFR